MLVTPLYVLGALELTVLASLLVPLSPLNSFGIAICGVGKTPYGLAVCGTISIFLLAFVASGMFDVSRLSMYEESHGGDRSCSSQLGALLAGADFVCGIALAKLSAVMLTLDRLKRNHGVLKKQAENLQVEYKRLMDSNGVVTGDEATAKLQGKVLDTETRLMALDKKNVMLAIANDTLAAEKKAAEATSAALKKQAVGVSKEYERLIGENESLKDQIHELENAGGQEERKKDS